MWAGTNGTTIHIPSMPLHRGYGDTSDTGTPDTGTQYLTPRCRSAISAAPGCPTTTTRVKTQPLFPLSIPFFLHARPLSPEATIVVALPESSELSVGRGKRQAIPQESQHSRPHPTVPIDICAARASQSSARWCDLSVTFARRRLPQPPQRSLARPRCE